MNFQYTKYQSLLHSGLAPAIKPILQHTKGLFSYFLPVHFDWFVVLLGFTLIKQ